MPVCNFDFKKVGPFNQTIFLGCSISDFNINLGWGADASTCTIKLVEDTARHPQDASYAPIDTTLSTLLSSTQSSKVFDNNTLNAPDNSKSLFKNIAQKLVDNENYRDLEDVSKLDMGIKDNGKIMWDTSLLGSDSADSARKTLLLADPGFIGWKHTIMGCPAYFKFHDIEFGGYIKKWTYSNNGLYDVELNSFGSLLTGCKLILQQYRGSISTLLNTTGGSVAVPYGDTSVSAFNGTIANGNIPNVFNIYGYLESQGFGTSLVSERGIPARVVYNALVELLGGSTRQQNMYSPYGAIVAKTPMRKDDSGTESFINPSSATVSSIPLSQLGLLKTVVAVDGLDRSLLALDISEVPRPPDSVMLSQIEMSINDFIDYCCKQAGVEYIVDFVPTNNSSFSGIIKIRTISRRIQPPPNILRNFFNTLTKNDAVLSASVGEEFSDQDVRTVIVGGPQERLYQVSSNTVSRYRSYRRFEPDDRSFIEYAGDVNETYLNAGNVRNTTRVPSAHKQRWYDYAFIDGAVVAQQTTTNDYFSTFSMGYSSMTVYKGAYETNTPSLGSFDAFNVGNSSASYPIYADLISPYFGRDIDGNVRKVFFDKSTSQLQVMINTRDIASFFPTYGVSGSFLVWENEIRAAMSGFDNWLTYVFEMSKLGFNLSTGTLIYAYIRNAFGTNIANKVFLNGLGLDKSGGKPSALPTIPPVGDTISPLSGLSYTNAILGVLQKLHSFFQDLGTRHYGKEFLVRIPSVSSSLDSAGVRHDYTISDSGWEEEGNFIDDTIMIGSSLANSLADESGKFGVILGYNNIAEYTYTNLDNTASNLNLSVTIDNIIASLKNPNPNGGWYFPLIPEIEASEVYWAPYTTYNIPGSLPPGPLVSKPTLNISASFPSNYTTAHGRSPSDQDKYKIYVKGSTVDAAPENKYNRKMLYTSDATYCVVSSPGPVWIRSPRPLISIMMEDLLLFDAKGVDTPGDSGAFAIPGVRAAFSNLNIPHNAAMMIWAVIESSLGDGVIRPNAPFVYNVEIHPRAAIPCFAAVPVKLNNYVYGPWSSHPNLIRPLIFPNAGEPNSTVYTDNIVGGVKVEIDTELTPWNYGGIENLDYAVLSRVAEENNYQQILENGQITVAGIQYGSAGVGYRLLDANMGPVINSIVTQVAEDGVKTTFGLRTYSRKLGFYNRESAENIARIGRESLKRRKEIADNIRNLALGSSRNSTDSDFSDSRPKAMNWSPVSVIVGNAYPFVHKNSSLTNTADQMGFGPSWHLRPQIPSTISSNPQNMVRQQTQVSIYDPGELPAVFRDVSYNDTSIMSIDGILSPISFYPTPYGSTYAITAYLRSKCPYCKGQGTVTYNYLDTSTLLTTSATPASFNTLKTARTQKTEPCRFCLPDAQKAESYKKNVKPSETIPPYIVASGDDLTIINNSQNTFASNNPAINRYTLNPMVMSVGEFSCSTNKQNADSCGHSIDVVAFGDRDSAAGGLRAALSNSISSNYADTNNRFFGLRGPLMVHGWGYDIEGYPVPNASGEFKIANGVIVRDNSNNPVYKNQILQADGSYSAPYKENSFYKGWAQLPSTWPVGPVDLRWDDDAGVWTVGNNYKPVWVVLENDLVNSDPVRGTILEGYLDNDPLPNNLRKLVFVKDGSKLFSAPRGAAIYCKYNSNNGFYEPIYNQPYVTSGTIIGGSLATIYKAYNGSSITPPGATPESYQSNFTNPLNLNVSVNSLGLFIYLNGSWVLQAART